jgi:hypothetical protein
MHHLLIKNQLASLRLAQAKVRCFSTKVMWPYRLVSYNPMSGKCLSVEWKAAPPWRQYLNGYKETSLKEDCLKGKA